MIYLTKKPKKKNKKIKKTWLFYFVVLSMSMKTCYFSYTAYAELFVIYRKFRTLQ